MTVQAYLRLEGLTKRFGETTAVDRVSLKVEEGELLAVVGPSGCGKTTLLRLLAGLEVPDAGGITLGGEMLFIQSAAGTGPAPQTAGGDGLPELCPVAAQERL